MKVKNIIIVNDFAHINGGAGKVALTSAVRLADKGYNVYLFAASGPVCDEIRRSKVKVVLTGQYDILHDSYRMRAVVQGLWNVKAYRTLAKLLADLDKSETVVHVHGWTKALSASIFSVLRRYGIRTFVTLHDFFLYCPNGGFYNYRTQKICELQPMGVRCIFCNCDPRSRLQKIWRIMRQVVQNCLIHRMLNQITFLSISNLTEEIFRKQFGLTPRLIKVDNPVDLSMEADLSFQSREVYLFMARLSPEKGLDLFCEAVTQTRVRGVVLGNGELLDTYKKKYPMIIFTGWVTGIEKENYMKIAKAFVFPSKWYETFGLSVAEMQSCGIPCIVPDKNAAAEQIIDGETGFIFQIGSLKSLKDKIVCMEKMKIEDLARMSQQAFEYSLRENYSMETHLENVTKLYDSNF